MASWPSAEVDNFPISWPSTSQFDDMVWDEFGETDDHIVPNPHGLAKKSIWVSNSDRRKRLHLEATPMSLKISGQVFQEVQKTSSSKAANEENVIDSVLSKPEQPLYYMNAPSLREEQDSLFNGIPAAGSEILYEEKPTTVARSKREIGTFAGLSPSQVLIKEESSDLDLSELYMNNSLYQEDDSSIMSCSSPFPLFEVGVEEDELELFGAENTADTKSTMLDLSWNNDDLDDMDKLFQDGDVSLGQEANDCLVPFPWSSSSQSLDGSAIRNSLSSEKRSFTIESTKLEEINQENDVKKDSIFQDCAPLEEKKDRQMLLAVKEDLQMSLKDHGVPHFSTDEANELPQVVNSRQLSPQHHHLAGPLHSTGDILVQETRSNGSSDYAHISRKQHMQKDMDIPSKSFSSADKGSRAKQRASSRRDKFKREISHRRGHCLTHTNFQVLPISMRERCLPMKSSQQLWGLTPSAPSSFKGLSPAFQQPPLMRADPLVYKQRPNSLPGLPMGSRPSICNLPLLVPKPSSTTPHLQRFRPLLTGYQHPFIEKQKFNQIPKKVVDAPIYPPFDDNKMTFLEKEENSVYQETLQARSGCEHHLQNVVSQQVAMDPKQKQQTMQQSQEGPFTAAGVTRLMHSSDAELGHANSGIPMSAAACEETMKESENLLEDKVLRQLQTIVLKLDARTRLCFRDALYRLSKSAMRRKGVGDNGSSTSSTEKPLLEPDVLNFACKADPTSLSGISRLTGANMLDAVGVDLVEAETNRIDRTIANMLFHKPSNSSMQPFVPLSGIDATFNGASLLPFVPESPLALHPSVLQ